MLKKLLLAAALVLAASAPALPQAGQFPSGYVQGNAGPLAAQGSPQSLSAMFSRGFCATAGAFPIYNATSATWVCSTVGGNGSNATLNGGLFNIQGTNDVICCAIPAAARFQVVHGSTSAPITAINLPTVSIDRVEALSGLAGPQSTSLYVSNTGQNDAQQPNGIISSVSNTGANDALAIEAISAVTGNFAAFGYYADVRANGVGSSAIAYEDGVSNNTGLDIPYHNSTGFQTIGHFDLVSGGANLNSYFIQFRGGPLTDVGIGVWPSSIKTSTFRDESSAVTSLDIRGSHTNGLDLSGGTYSSNQIKGTNFTIANSGTETISGSTGTGYVVTDSFVTGAFISSTQATHSAVIGTLSNHPLIFNINSVPVGAITAAGIWQFGSQSSALTGQTQYVGGTSGNVTVQAQAVAGTYNFNLPTSAGTSGQPLLSAGGGASPMTFGTLGPAAGGTGNTTLTAHAVLLGEGTSNVAFATTGTGGRILTDQGAGFDPSFQTMSGDATFAAGGALTLAAVNSNVGTFGSATASPAFTVNSKGLITAASSSTIAGRLVNVQVFTATGANTYTPTTGTNKAVVYTYGAGGAGGGAAAAGGSAFAAGAGGGAGGLCINYMLTISGTVTVTIGAGATAGLAGNNPGNAGGNSSFGLSCTASGGGGGAGGAASTTGTTSGAPGAGGTSSGGTMNVTGPAGQAGIVVTGPAIISGAGANSFLGAGGASLFTTGTGNAGSACGAGGSGGASYNGGGATAGGAGGNGCSIVYEYS